MRIVLVAALISLAAVGCAGGSGASADDRTEVVAALFPLGEAARRSGVDVEVVDLTPPGVDPHDLELSSDEIDHILDADVAIVMGDGFQPAIEDVAADRDGPTVKVLDAIDRDTHDPHVWLDPTVMSDIAGAVAHQLGGNARPFQADLAALDERYREALSSCRSNVLVTSHDAFGYLADRYGLRVETISGLLPEAEPDPAKLDQLADLVEREGVTTVFTEPLLSKRAAETLARETGAHVAVLDPLESDPGVGYVAAMDANLEALTKGLGCAGAK